MEEFTMLGTFELPSKGIFYGDGSISEVTLRAMTTNEEMKRLNHSEKGYKIMADVIDACMVDKFPVSSYDMCLADYQFLLHKLRIVTYGNEYKMRVPCPFCASQPDIQVDLNALDVIYFDEETFRKYLELDLPLSGRHIKLRVQTPRILDSINTRAREQKRRTPDMEGDPTFIFTLESLIAEVDREPADPIDVLKLVRNMSMMDANYILKYTQKLTESFGVVSTMEVECPICGLSHDANFRVTSEFFGPSIDI